MKRLKVEVGSDARRWDTYLIEVDDDFDPEGEDAEKVVADLVAAEQATHVSTEYENEGGEFPAERVDLISADAVTDIVAPTS